MFERGRRRTNVDDDDSRGTRSRRPRLRSSRTRNPRRRVPRRHRPVDLRHWGGRLLPCEGPLGEPRRDPALCPPGHRPAHRRRRPRRRPARQVPEGRSNAEARSSSLRPAMTGTPSWSKSSSGWGRMTSAASLRTASRRRIKLARRSAATSPASRRPACRCCPAGCPHRLRYAYGPDYALPHSMIVDASGGRYCDDSYWVDIVAKTHRSRRPAPPLLPRLRRPAPSEVRLRPVHPGGDTPKGSSPPPRPWRGWAPPSASTAPALAATAAAFCEHAPRGEDPTGPWHRRVHPPVYR